MRSSSLRRWTALSGAALLSSMTAAAAIAAGPVTVTLNGNTLNLNPAPTERAGRVFVPLRGVFENLGASVVYAGGVINATGRGHTVQLRIGSQQATVDGQQQTVDVAPFIIGASTYVPLRFVSQALGATVNYDGANRVVAIAAGGAQAAQAPANQTITPAPRNGNGGSITLTNEQPGRDASVTARRPTIGASFSGTVDPGSVRVMLDDNDVSNDSTRSPRGFLYYPRAPLPAGQHRVRVSGTDSSGSPFNRGWTFTSGTSAATVEEITNVRPANGSTVPNQFTISGRTTPGAHVTIQVGTTTRTVGGLIGAILGASSGGNNTVFNVTADANGRFSQPINASVAAGTQVAIIIGATDPRTGASATPVQETVTVQ